MATSNSLHLSSISVTCVPSMVAMVSCWAGSWTELRTVVSQVSGSLWAESDESRTSRTSVSPSKQTCTCRTRHQVCLLRKDIPEYMLEKFRPCLALRHSASDRYSFFHASIAPGKLASSMEENLDSRVFMFEDLDCRVLRSASTATMQASSVSWCHGHIVSQVLSSPKWLTFLPLQLGHLL